MVELFRKTKSVPTEAPPQLTRVEQEQLAREQLEEKKEVLESEKIYRRGVVTVRDIIAPASMKVETRYLELGSKFVRTVFVIAYPRYIRVGWFAPVINLNVQLDIAMYFYPVSVEIILKQLIH